MSRSSLKPFHFLIAPFSYYWALVLPGDVTLIIDIQKYISEIKVRLYIFFSIPNCITLN